MFDSLRRLHRKAIFGGVCVVSGIMLRRKLSELCSGVKQHMISGAVLCVDKVQLVAIVDTRLRSKEASRMWKSAA